MPRPLRALLLLTLLVSAGVAWAFDPGDGTEAVLTDPAGQRLIGYGVVQGGVLVLRLAERADRFVLLLLGPDGEVRTLDGIQGGGGALIVTDEAGARVPLGTLLGRSDVMLRVVHGASGGARNPAAGSDDGGSGDPGSGDPGSDDGSDDGSGDGSGGSEGGTVPEDGSGADASGAEGGTLVMPPPRDGGAEEGDGAP